MGAIKNIMEHPEWGTIIVARNARARHIIFRSRPDGIHVTVPTLATRSDIERAIKECVPKLLQKQQKNLYTILYQAKTQKSFQK